ncbi:DgyrCDS672 [Dimorphilus gyrociliatus]|uniref:DgyrCDS672 n=1 Tax=Dimorphilus gyrociliatus TaxID=2664684 RepID=A0A7I8V6W5_9ANNE|nr:DgyrCDS672 [Dimorphilus gyrociliatus]
MTLSLINIPSADDYSAREIREWAPGTTEVVVEPVGKWFETYNNRRAKSSLSFASVKSTTSEEEDNEEDIELCPEDDDYVFNRDPAEWKKQDHYKILGLSRLRYKATDKHIKLAYKKKVLQHHPDKRKARGIPTEKADADFSCITKAYEILGNPIKRRSYDSVDPAFDDSVPNSKTVTKETFYETYSPVFERNARWSIRKKVPLIGDDSTPYEDVCEFYNFWFEFNSWREFSYLDEEDVDKGENRDERRWIEKQNKSARKEKRKEEMMRIRSLVESAYNLDPRVLKQKEEEKQKKLAIKQARKEEVRKRIEEENRKKREEEERLAKIKEEEEKKVKAEEDRLKKEREAIRNKTKKERKALRNMAKNFDYFTTEESQRVHNMAEVDKLAELLELTKLQELNTALSSKKEKDLAAAEFFKFSKELNARLDEEKRKQIEDSQKSADYSSESKSNRNWSPEDCTALVKAVNLFPAGTNKRWEVVAQYVNEHGKGKFNAKEVLAKAKSMQKLDPNQKKEVNARAYENFDKTVKDVNSKPGGGISQRYETVAEQQIAERGTNPSPWSASEQKLLEHALKTYPASTPNRWDAIASTIPNRSKKDCIQRCKELAEMVRAKKAATSKS